MIIFYYKNIISKIFLIFFFSFFLFSCNALNTGITENPIDPKKTKNIYTPNIKIKIKDINELTFADINETNNDYTDNSVQDSAIKEYFGLYDYVYEYQLGPGDEIVINLTETDDIDGNYLIDPFGMIDLPYVGKINVKDLTSAEAQNMLLSILKKFYKNPDLQLDIVAFNSSKVYVTGTVRNQLVIDMSDKPIRVLDALIRANVNTTGNDNLSSTSGIIRRDNRVYEIDLLNAIKGTDTKENFYLKKDDVIFIDRNPNSILVFGEVSRPGSYFPYAGYSLTQLVSDSGINQLTADAKNIFVLRESFDEELQIDVFKMNIKNPINLIAGRKFKLNKRDIVYIPASDLVKWNRVISLLLPQTNLFKSYNPIIQNGLDANNLNIQ
jgi:polysaccharide export outer membrane protein